MKPNIAFPFPVGPATATHQDLLNQGLRQALGTSQPALRTQALELVSAHLVHPKLILDTPLLTDSHVWRREALVISDAFEAVTNGMEEPGVLEALETLEPDSIFQPWRHLVLAIHFFHEHLDEAVTRHLRQIPPASPLQAAARPLALLVGISMEGALGPAQRKLLDTVAKPEPRIIQVVQDVAEGLESGNEVLFWEALADWLEEVVPQAPEKAKSALLWAWNQLEWLEFDESVPLDLGASLWGPGESFRLAALGTLPWDPEGAALLWFRFLLTALRENNFEETGLREALDLLERFRIAALEEGGPPEEWTEAWNNLTRTWNSEVEALGFAGLQVGGEVSEPVKAVPKMPVDGQLDLFA